MPNMITAIRAITSKPQRTSARGEVFSMDVPAPSRALVAVTPALSGDGLPQLTQRPGAPFLAQLIATDRMLPQTRSRNRAEPRDAMAAYADAARMLRANP